MKNSYILSFIILNFLALVLFLVISGFSASGNESGPTSSPSLERATFAGGCFWCMEPPFEKLPGVSKVISGYTGGKKENPTYKEVATGSTDHAEAIEVYYDKTQISYNDLLEVLWRNIDPTDDNGQFVDRGKQYRPAIFYHNKNQKKLAQISKDNLEKSKRFKKRLRSKLPRRLCFIQPRNTIRIFTKKIPRVTKYIVWDLEGISL